MIFSNKYLKVCGLACCLGFGLFIFSSRVRAESDSDSVDMSVVVVTRQTPETINDFNFSSFNSSPGQIKGASTESGSRSQKALKLELLVLVTSFSLFLMTLGYRRYRTKMTDDSFQ